ncbi:MAG: 3-phosphoshikimate 1-carboxyvinyltransferase [Firmicutes bacterium]|nr:3-phosphoshikimate 1-carboxyvinyltransferase [Bacillota bacterium]
MDTKIAGSPLSGAVVCPPSKSFAHRILIASFLAKNQKAVIKNLAHSNDIVATANCLKAMESGEKVLNCGESGSTLRFLLPIASALGINAEFKGEGRLGERPMEDLISVLNQNGAKINSEMPYKVSGKLNAGVYEISGSVSSQFISGLLLALPILDGDSEIVITSPLRSKGYVDITLEVLKDFGIKITKTDSGYFIKGNQAYIAPKEISVEGDFSNASFLLVAGALGKGVTVSGLNLNSVQGDKEILTVLKNAGANVEIISDSSVRVSRGNLKGMECNAEDIPDIVPIISVLLSRAKGESVIRNIERLRIKESDRVEATLSLLKAFGKKAECKGDSIIIKGDNNLAQNEKRTVLGFNDHRIVMCGAVMGAFNGGETVITDKEAVNKSYPNFYEDFLALGGRICD